jgi:cytochrome c
MQSSTVDNRRGELLSLACQACHTLTESGSHQVGPNLYGIFGRSAGQSPGFDYTSALRESGIVWSPSELDRWLADPAGFLPGTTMAFTGYQTADDRAALIEYLLDVTGR